ncbi:MAG: squalene/phytoene synthase family protein [Hyphomicrobiaceae bacterium]|nr:squalene/phytoene synthase family protein [Hyphomicrobiaceae bacterium]
MLLAAARDGAYDRAMAALLAPPPEREALLALAALSAELVRIAPQTRREPHMGEIRLQWWREALAPAAPPSGNPVADAVKAAMARHGWAAADIEGIVDAHAHDGLADAYADDAELIAGLRLGEGALFRLAAATLGMAPGAELDRLAEHAGVAYGLARRLLALPQLVALGHVPLPQARIDAAGLSLPEILAGEAEVAGLVADLGALAADRLALARPAVRGLGRRIRCAFLPLALVGSYLRKATRAGRNPLRDAAEVAPIERLARLLAAHALGRL